MPGPGGRGGRAQTTTTAANSRTSPDKEQHAVVYDLLSEGPIQGLSNGMSSIYLNDVPFIDSAAQEITKSRRITTTTTANNSKVSSAVFQTINEISVDNKTGLNLGTRHIVLDKAGATHSGGSISANSNLLTTSSSFFTSDMVSNTRVTSIPVYLTVAGAGSNGTDLKTKVQQFVSATQVRLVHHAATTVSGAAVSLDHKTTISSISGTTATLSAAPGVSVTNTAGQVSGAERTNNNNLKPLYNFDSVEASFRSGNLNQETIKHKNGFGSSSTVATPNIVLEQNDLRANIGTSGALSSSTYNNVELDEPSQNAGTAEDTLMTASFLGVSNPEEVDEVQITFEFGTSNALKNSSGAKGPSFVELQIHFEYSVDGGSSYISQHVIGDTNAGIQNGRKIHKFGSAFNSGVIRPRDLQMNPFTEEFAINIEKYQPFTDWRFRVRRITDTNFKDSSFQHTNPCSIKTVESIVKDKLQYPYTAYAATAFNAQDFDGSFPVRSYLIKGRKIKVPTNYITRDEAPSGVASYKRHITNGGTESSYQNWDGNFRGDADTFSPGSVNFPEVYCNNPVWVFYDLLTNTRYGMGQFIDSDLIDKYQLFRLARYCDELVPDGEGGMEPRFTCNVYINKGQEATKTLKQFASIFRGMALWMDGELTLIADKDQEPVYTFTKGNIIEGIFQYEGTGDRVRTNQVKVSWNDPSDNYRIATEYVEDQQSLLETGRIVRSETLAFGCTSRGQAHRLGKWKLLGERLEKETVTFTTGLAGAGLRPGDIIAVQDADRDRSSYSGRVSNTGTRSTTVIPLDRTITIPAYSSDYPPKLLLIYPRSGAYLNQDTAVISGTTYYRGDLLTSITTSVAASNTADDSNNPVEIYWSENARIESQPVSTSAGSVSSITVSSAFSAAPEAEAIWSLRLYNTDGTENTGTVKEYKVVSVKEDGNNYEVVGGAFVSSKFKEIERGHVLEPRPTDITPNPDDVIPAPQDISFTIVPQETTNTSIPTGEEGTTTGYNLVINWTAANNTDGTRYKFANGYEIEHDFSGRIRRQRVNATDLSLTYENVRAGIFFARVRTMNNTGSVSQYRQRSIEILESDLGGVGNSKIARVPKGGAINQTVEIAANGTISIGSNTWQYDNPNGETFTNSSSNTATYTQSFVGMGASAEAYLLFDASESTDRFKAIQLHSDNNVEYIKEVGASNNGFTAKTGTIAIAQNSNAVLGSGTAFNTEFTHGDLVKVVNGSSTTRTTGAATTASTSVTLSSANSSIKVGQKVTGTGISSTVFVEAISNTSLTLSSAETVGNGVTLTFTPVTYYGKVQFIESSTLMFLDEVVPTKYTDGTISKQSFKPNLTADALLCKVVTDGSTTYSISELYAVTKGIVGGDGQSNAIVYAYQRSATTLTSNPGAVTVSLAGATSGTITTGSLANGWSKTIPSGSNPLYVCAATAAGTGSTDTIAANEWSTPVILADSGDDGATGPRTVVTRLNFGASSTNAPTAPTSSNTNTFDFSDATFDNILSGWSHSTPTYASGNSNKYWYIDITVVESTFGGTQTLSFGSVTQAIGFSGLVTFSGAAITDGSTTKTPIEAGDVNSNVTSINGSVIQTGTILANRLKLSGTGAITIGSLTNDSNFITSGQAPVQSVNGSTGAVSITAAGLNISSSNVSGLSDAATTSVSSILAGNHTGNVNGVAAGTVTAGAAAGATANQNSNAQIIATLFSANTAITAGRISLTSGTTTFRANNTSSVASNSIDIDSTSANGGPRIVIADSS